MATSQDHTTHHASIIPPDERDPYSPAAGRTPDQVRHDIAALTVAADVLTGVLRTVLHPTFARAIERSRDRMEAEAFELHVALRTHRPPEFRGPATLDWFPVAPPATSGPIHLPTIPCVQCLTEVPDTELIMVPGTGACCAACARQVVDHD